MSQENVEIVRPNIDAFNRGDYEEALAALDQDVEWHSSDTESRSSSPAYRLVVVDIAASTSAFPDTAAALEAAGLEE